MCMHEAVGLPIPQVIMLICSQPQPTAERTMITDNYRPVNAIFLRISCASDTGDGMPLSANGIGTYFDQNR